MQLADGGRKGVNLQWGLLPSWCKDRRIASHMINARRETLAKKPAFRSAFRKRRCLIPATGFYEWQQTPAGKQPHHIHRPDNSLFAFAGLWEHWERETESIYSCTIVTTAANPLMQPVHQRMSVIIAAQDYRSWLDKNTSQEDLHSILGKLLFELLAFHFPDLNDYLQDSIEPLGQQFPPEILFRESRARLLWLSSVIVYFIIYVFCAPDTVHG
ncbi:SOS response-associated peptidase, partial [Thiolapillus sp.]|uniref:SOS response-associated peptidase n=1 Tax=Thiolapillus sp. TaxID=2017437 RepID=UPI003AF42CC0